MQAKYESLAGWLEHIERMHPRGEAGIVLGLDRVAIVAAELKQAHRLAGKPIVTVGGTNGKGSVVTYLSNILDRAGYKVGTYTSPHLVHFNERIRLNGIPSEDARIMAAFDHVEAARAATGESLTYFEFTTLAAVEVFLDAEVDVLILEVGLGGRLDAVNLYDPDVAVITSVALDHQDYLGDTREAIALEKIGIARAGQPIVVAEPELPVPALKELASRGAIVYLVGEAFGFEPLPGEEGKPSIQWRYWLRKPGTPVEAMQRRGGLAYPGLRGRIQLRNAAAAMTVIEALQDRLPVAMGAVRRGLLESELAGRFQVIPGPPDLVLDVAHNPEAARVLATNLGQLAFAHTQHGVLGMMADKDMAGVLQPLVKLITRWYLTPVDSVRSATPEQLQATLCELGVKPAQIECFQNPALAYAAARKNAAESDRIVAFGSFLTVADVLRDLGRTA
ncbi:MAG: bifunctional folylpolyglutamate synthase/dihydrofolate synthase [Rhodocyclaceae bacterium]|jgi:dihydrofolate synthase/folylpolyglutamate synthase|nr:bifunctional folylpolyglutamate synthase/dihydrofolate synthase [Rhodocyclaceae bacterium]